MSSVEVADQWGTWMAEIDTCRVAALAYATAGIPVLPFGLDDPEMATTDLAKVEAHWGAHPGAKVAIVVDGKIRPVPLSMKRTLKGAPSMPKLPVTLDNALYAAALDYARRGWKVLPCVPRGKEPIGHLVPHAYQDATSDEATIAQWWTAEPEANIGIATVDGLAVIDQDRHHPDRDGVEAWDEILKRHDMTEDTLVAITGSDGRHSVYLDAPGHPQSSSREGTVLEGVPGIDRKSGSGYIIVAPSIHPNGNPYRWENLGADIATLPEWFYTAAKSTAVAEGEPFHPKEQETVPEVNLDELDEDERDLIEYVDTDAPLSLNTLMRIIDGDPEADQSQLISKITMGARAANFDPERLYLMLKKPEHVGGDGLRRRIEKYGEAWTRGWYWRTVRKSDSYRASSLINLRALRSESEEYHWPPTITFVGRNGKCQTVRGPMAKTVLRAALDIATETTTTAPMLGCDRQLPERTGIKSEKTCSKAVQALEWLGWWKAEDDSPTGRQNAYLYVFDLDPQSRVNPPKCVATLVTLGRPLRPSEEMYTELEARGFKPTRLTEEEWVEWEKIATADRHRAVRGRWSHV